MKCDNDRADPILEPRCDGSPAKVKMYLQMDDGWECLYLCFECAKAIRTAAWEAGCGYCSGAIPREER